VQDTLALSGQTAAPDSNRLLSVFHWELLCNRNCIPNGLSVEYIVWWHTQLHH